MMKFLKGLGNFFFYPITFIQSGKTASKTAEFFTKHPSLIFIVAVFLSAIIYVVHYFVVK